VISFAIFFDLLVQTTFLRCGGYLVSQIPHSANGRVAKELIGAAKVGKSVQITESLLTIFTPAQKTKSHSSAVWLINN
jgi:hypothetical protein